MKSVGHRNLLHKLWTKAVETEDYDKEEWKEFERLMGGTKTEETVENLSKCAKELLVELTKDSKPEVIISTAIYAVGLSLAKILQNIEEKLDASKKT